MDITKNSKQLLFHLYKEFERKQKEEIPRDRALFMGNADEIKERFPLPNHWKM